MPIKFIPLARTPAKPDCLACLPPPVDPEIICSAGSICNVACIPVEFSGDALPTFVVGGVYSYQILTNNVPTPPVVYDLIGGSWPAGITMNSDGLVSGTPTTALNGTVLISATNCGGVTHTYTLNWSTVSCVAPTVSAPTQTAVDVGAGSAVSISGSSFRTAGAAIVYSLTGAPGWLTVNSVTGQITGTAPSIGFTDFTLALNLTNSCGTVATSIPIHLACVAVDLTALVYTSPLIVGHAITGHIAYSGSTPVTFSITAGSLPAGITLDASTGVFSGSPSGSPGTSSFTVHAVNACGTSDLPVSITVVADVTNTIRWGNLIYGPYGTVAPTFVAGDFTGSNPDYTSAGTSTSSSRVGSYTFPANAGARQVIWIADTLLTGSPSFTAGGFPVAFDPSANTSLQSLTISGVAGKVFFTSDVSYGGFIMVVS